MRRLIVTCECGERMKVPRSAIGKTGMCPTCGRRLRISNDNSHSAASASRVREPVRTASTEGGRGGPGGFGAATPDAKERFGKAVDLYFCKRYGEALAILSSLVRQLPDDPDVECARTLCLKALRIPTRLALPGGSVSAPRLAAPEAAPQRDEVPAEHPPVEAAEAPAAPEASDPQPSPVGEADEDDPPARDAPASSVGLDAEAVKAFVLDKMLHGDSAEEQLKAAELASRLLGLIGDDTGKPIEAIGTLEELQAALRARQDGTDNEGGTDDSWEDSKGVRDVVDL
ncbi:MAG: hypothetical protein GY851_15395 [bacterium]|nr:hypothetical protein [bacterium]